MRKPRVPFTPEVAQRILDALQSGQGLRRLTRQPGMPTRPTIMRWLKARPEFAAEVWVSRFDGGLQPGQPGLPSRYRPALADEIYDRLCAGEPLRSICRSRHMPSRSTVHTWMKQHPDFARHVALARDFADWAAAERQVAAWGHPDWLRGPKSR